MTYNIFRALLACNARKESLGFPWGFEKLGGNGNALSCRLFIEDRHEAIFVESQSPMMLLGKLDNCFSTVLAILRPNSNKVRLINGAVISRL